MSEFLRYILLYFHKKKHGPFHTSFVIAMKCPEGKIYKACGSDTQPSCSLPTVTPKDNSTCVEGCFCPEGNLKLIFHAYYEVLTSYCFVSDDGINYFEPSELIDIFGTTFSHFRSQVHNIPIDLLNVLV